VHNFDLSINSAAANGYGVSNFFPFFEAESRLSWNLGDRHSPAIPETIQHPVEVFMPLTQARVIEGVFTHAQYIFNPDPVVRQKIVCRPSLDDSLAFTSKKKEGAS
jgi:hypothetical protein